MNNNISTIDNLMFLAFCDETCNDVTVISRGNSSIYFKDRIDFRPETIMFGLHKMDDGRYFFKRYVHSDTVDMESKDMFIADHNKTAYFSDMSNAIKAYSDYRFNVL